MSNNPIIHNLNRMQELFKYINIYILRNDAIK